VKNILYLFLCLAPIFVSAQDAPLRIADKKPVLKQCLQVVDEIQREQCTNEGMLTYLYKSIVYPDTALAQELEGMVVAEIVIGKSGSVIAHKLLKDIGGGCGEEVSRVLEELTKLSPIWSPAFKDGVPVDYAMTIPVKFKMPEPPAPPLPYNIYGTDTVYHTYSVAPVFGKDIQVLEKKLLDELTYPKGFEDSCMVGSMVAQIVVGKNGEINIIDIIDCEDLGIDFKFQLIELINKTTGGWTPAMFDSIPVHAFHNIRAVFSPKSEGCKTAASNYTAANEMARQGELKYAQGDFDNALVDWGKAIDLFPENAEFRLLRGQALMEKGVMKAQCCEDLTMAGQHVSLDPILSSVLPLVCQTAALDTIVPDSTAVEKN